MKRRICIVTGSRAEFGLLDPVMRAVREHQDLELLVVAAGSHLVGDEPTVRDVEARFAVSARIEMQAPGQAGRIADAEAVGRGVGGFARAFGGLRPGWVVVLGDRIEAFAAASAASIGGLALAHIHGGDRAEGIADEAMRHAITRLAHMHCAASEQSAQRIVRMGERPDRVFFTGSPAIDGLSSIEAMDDEAAQQLGEPRIVLLMHPSGLTPASERAMVRAACEAVACHERTGRVLVLDPNLDAGREVVLEELQAAVRLNGWRTAPHLTRERFIGLLKRLARGGGVLAGNSSAGLIECAALRVPVVNVGPRQGGRERWPNVIDAQDEGAAAIGRALGAAGRLAPDGAHGYGGGDAGRRIAALLAGTDPGEPGFLRKRITY